MHVFVISVRAARAAAVYLLWGTLPGLACEGARTLADLHDGYAAVLTASSSDAAAAQYALRRALDGLDIAQLARALTAEGAPADLSRLARLIEGATAAAQDAKDGGSGQASGRDATNLAYAIRLMRATGCVHVGRAGDSGSDNDRSQGEGSEEAAAVSGPRAGGLEKAVSVLGIVLLAFALFAGAAALASRTWIMRVRHVRRLPRFPVKIDAKVQLSTGATAAARVLDISVGGAKLMWNDAPDARSHVTLLVGDLAMDAQVMWSNAHFVGLMFARQLEDAEFTTLVRLDGVSAAPQAKSGV